eukprot:COSAG05_NODE_214_length_13907_cov_28.992178_29_plen_40_part_00
MPKKPVSFELTGPFPDSMQDIQKQIGTTPSTYLWVASLR